MIVAATLAGFLQVVSAALPSVSSPRVLTVRPATVATGTRIPLVSRPDGELGVPADALLRALGGTVERTATGHFVLSRQNATVDVADQSAFAATSSGVMPVAAPPWVDRGKLFVPLADVGDIVPRLGSGIIYDPARTELRLFVGLPPGNPHRLAQRSDVFSRSPDRSAATSRDADAEPDRPGVSPAGDVLEGADPPQASVPEASLSEHRHLVVVDAGHGGPDHGMVGPVGSTHPIYEKDITLAVARKVAASLRKKGVDVVETRTTDTLIALSDRGRIANARHGDLFLSIHVNAANPNWHDPSAARGFETYFLAEAKTEDARRVEQMENESVRFETGADAPAHDPLNFIINDMAQNEHLRESAELATIVQRHLAAMHPGPDRGVKQAGFRVLVTAYIPAVLVEIGFGTNPAEARYLADPSAESRIASSIAAATVEYLGRYERRVSTADR